MLRFFLIFNIIWGFILNLDGLNEGTIPQINKSNIKAPQIYSDFRKFQVISSNPKNWGRGAKLACYYLAVKCMELRSIISSNFGNEPAAKKYKAEAEKFEAVHIRHTISKMTRALAKDAFGSDLLVTARNVANVQVLEHGADVQAAKDLNQKLKNERDKFSGKLTKLQAMNLSSVFNKIEESNNVSWQGCITKGVCTGTSFHFISSYFESKKSGKSTESTLVHCAKAYEKGVPAEAAGTHAVYKHYKEDLIAAYLNNLEQTGECISEGGKSASTSEFLDQQIPLLTQGAFQIGFMHRNASHSIVFIKEKDGSFIFDPIYGLIKCNKQNPQKTLLKHLSLYTPLESTAPNKTGPSYVVDIQKYNKIAE
jgi:hypothetical protein